MSKLQRTPVGVPSPVYGDDQALMSIRENLTRTPSPVSRVKRFSGYAILCNRTLTTLRKATGE